MASIPASWLVKIQNNVLSAGGTALELVGMVLNGVDPRVPIGTIASFASAAAVGAYFGLGSTSYALAEIYFGGFNGANNTPAQMLFTQYNQAAVGGYLRGGSVAGLTIAQLQAITGSLTVSINGTPVTISSLNLSSATSFTAAAAILQAGLTGTTVTYDSVSGAFWITSATTGATSAILFATGSASASLGLTAAAGAVQSPGAAAAVPGVFMSTLIANSQNWVGFMTDYLPAISVMEAFALWTSQQGNRYVYAAWDTALAPTLVGDTTSFGYVCGQNQYSGVVPIWQSVSDNGSKAAFLLGCIASQDFTETAGRITFDFKSQSGLTIDVTTQIVASNLVASNYNFYAVIGAAAQQFVFFTPGSVIGSYEFLDAYVDQIWMTNQFQLAFMVLLTQAKSIPYNPAGYAMIKTALMTAILQAVTFGAIEPGVVLSSEQAQLVNTQAGGAVATTVQNVGWYLSVTDPGPQARAARQSPNILFWYTDGGSVQSINMTSTDVQ